MAHEYTVHPVAELFPLMTAEEYAGLKADMAEHGQRESITLWRGLLIDGRNRLKACNELGIEPLIGELMDETDPVSWVISLNLHRRHLSTGQRAAIAAKMADQKHGGDRKSVAIKSQIQLSISDAAKLLNVSPASIKQAKQLIENAPPEVMQALESGSITLNAATKLTKLNRPVVQSDHELPTAEERESVTKIMAFVRAELARLSESERTKATQGVRQVLNEVGNPKQRTHEEIEAQAASEFEPTRQIYAQRDAARDAELAKQRAAREAKRKAKIEKAELAAKQRVAEWLASRTTIEKS